MAFYVADIFILIAFCMSIKLNVVLEDTGENVGKSLRKIFTIPSFVFFNMLFISGMNYGVESSYVYIYLKEDLGMEMTL